MFGDIKPRFLRQLLKTGSLLICHVNIGSFHFSLGNGVPIVRTIIISAFTEIVKPPKLGNL